MFKIATSRSILASTPFQLIRPLTFLLLASSICICYFPLDTLTLVHSFTNSNLV